MDLDTDKDRCWFKKIYSYTAVCMYVGTQIFADKNSQNGNNAVEMQYLACFSFDQWVCSSCLFNDLFH